MSGDQADPAAPIMIRCMDTYAGGPDELLPLDQAAERIAKGYPDETRHVELARIRIALRHGRQLSTGWRIYRRVDP